MRSLRNPAPASGVYQVTQRVGARPLHPTRLPDLDDLEVGAPQIQAGFQRQTVTDTANGRLTGWGIRPHAQSQTLHPLWADHRLIIYPDAFQLPQAPVAQAAPQVAQAVV